MSPYPPPLISIESSKMLIHAIASAHPVSNMLNKLHGQPESYDKKSKYKFGRTLGAGTYGIVREADGPTGKAG
jgi:calcium/calmodulin-dependent protein kinase I